MKLKEKYKREYRIWKNMRARCSAPCLSGNVYQKRGIKVCKRWDKFSNFIEDMGKCPENYSIDRIDTYLDYTPENCRWANASTQAKNRGKFNKLFTYNGQTKILKDWARFYGIKYNTLYGRIYSSGLTFEEAIKEDPFNRLIEYQGKKQILTDWCKELKAPFNLLNDRIHKGWSIERAFETPGPGYSRYSPSPSES